MTQGQHKTTHRSACIGLWLARCSWKLQANEWTGTLLVSAPLICRNQIKLSTYHDWRQNPTFCCVRNLAGIDGLGCSKLGKACDGNSNEEDEMHLDFDDLDVLNSLV